MHSICKQITGLPVCSSGRTTGGLCVVLNIQQAVSLARRIRGVVASVPGCYSNSVMPTV